MGRQITLTENERRWLRQEVQIEVEDLTDGNRLRYPPVGDPLEQKVGMIRHLTRVLDIVGWHEEPTLSPESKSFTLDEQAICGLTYVHFMRQDPDNPDDEEAAAQLAKWIGLAESTETDEAGAAVSAEEAISEEVGGRLRFVGEARARILDWTAMEAVGEMEGGMEADHLPRGDDSRAIAARSAYERTTPYMALIREVGDLGLETAPAAKVLGQLAREWSERDDASLGGLVRDEPDNAKEIEKEREQARLSRTIYEQAESFWLTLMQKERVAAVQAGGDC